MLAAASGRVLSRSFHIALKVGIEVIEQAQAIKNGGESNSEKEPELIWNRSELSVMLEHVQAHVAPTDVDPGAGIQWLTKIRQRYPGADDIRKLAIPTDTAVDVSSEKEGDMWMVTAGRSVLVRVKPF